MTYREWLQREIASAECAAGRGSEDDEIRAEALRQSLAALDRENEALGDTDPCGHPVITLPRDRRIALAAERFASAELNYLKARQDRMEKVLDGAPDSCSESLAAMLAARASRNNAFADLQAEIESA